MRLVVRLSLVLVLISTIDLSSFNPGALGGSAISVDLLKYILSNLRRGSTILELGSGSGTGELAKYYTTYSIEHNNFWVNKFKTNYIYAPIKNYGTFKWYDHNIVAAKIPKKYDLILIDGPPGFIGRIGFFHFLHLFNTTLPLIFDDVQRSDDLKHAQAVAEKLQKTIEVYKCSDGKQFAVIK